MSFEPKTRICLCERCGFVWKTTQRHKSGNWKKPKSCAKCKSKVWGQPRTYGGKYLNGLAPMAKRYKPTGRAAAKLKSDI